MKVFIVMRRVLLLMTLGLVFGVDGKSQGTGEGKSVVVEPMSGGFGFATPEKLSSVSQDDIGEGYPCLSRSGFRLYYKSGNGPYVMKAERSSSIGAFTPVGRLDLEIFNLSSAWINDDESELYVCTGIEKSIYLVKRVGSGDSYRKDVMLQLLDSNGVTSIAPGFLSSVSLTPDKSELYVFHETLGCIGFRRKSDNVYIQSDLLERPAGFRLETSQLSRDGLNLLVTGIDSTKSSYISNIYIVGRSKLGEKFRVSEFQLLLRGGDSGLRLSQPTMTDNASQLVCTGNKGAYWFENDLYLSYNVIDGISSEEGSAVGSRVFPHPFDESFRVKVDGFMGGRARLLCIEGSVLAERELQSNDLEFDMVGYGSGIYIVELSNGNKRMMLKAVKR